VPGLLKTTTKVIAARTPHNVRLILACNLLEVVRNPKNIRNISPAPQIRRIKFHTASVRIPNDAITKSKNVGTPNVIKPAISNIDSNGYFTKIDLLILRLWSTYRLK
jgi:hypothetical protein